MRLGGQNPKRLAFAAALLVIGVFLFVRTFLGSSNRPAVATAASAPAAEASQQPAERTGRRVQSRRTSGDTPPKGLLSLDPRLRLDLLKESEGTEYKGSGRNIFRAEAAPVEIPKPVVSPVTSNPQTTSTGPPPPPRINLKFFGFASSPGEPKKIFLSQGEDVFIAAEGDIVARRYKVLKIGPTSVEIEDMLSNSRQTIPLTQG
jgi:hypothetical protein